MDRRLRGHDRGDVPGEDAQRAERQGYGADRAVLPEPGGLLPARRAGGGGPGGLRRLLFQRV